MTTEEKIEIAKTAIDRNMDKDELYYSDDMYGREKFTDDVWEYVDECRKIGIIKFFDKYKNV